MVSLSRQLKAGIATVLALSLAAPTIALGAAAKPVVTTGGVAKLTPSTASLLGKVNPSGAATTYRFQYGPTSLYGALTPPVSAGGAAATTNVVADIGGLAPATTYHYRLVASNARGTSTGSDRTFKTLNQPLGLTLGATPNPVAFGKPAVLAGVLSGTGNEGRQVGLQSNPFPYTQGFVNTGNPQVIGATGAFAFPLLAVAQNTQFRVLIPTKPNIVSPIVFVGAAPRVATTVSATRVRRGQRVRFSGTVKPGQGGERIAIQKLKGTSWRTVAGSITRRAASGAARYSKRIRIGRGGSYRVFVAVADGRFVANSGRTVKLRLR